MKKIQISSPIEPACHLRVARSAQRSGKISVKKCISVNFIDSGNCEVTNTVAPFEPTYKVEAVPEAEVMGEDAKTLKPNKWFTRVNYHILGLRALAVLVVMGGMYTAYIGFTRNHLMDEQVAVLEQKAMAQGGEGSDSSTSGQGDSPVPTTSNRPTKDDVNNFVTQNNLPKRIEINGIEVYARVKEVGVNNRGFVDAPLSIHDAAWYNGSSSPAQIPGASIIVGHVGSRGLPGVFANLHKLNSGDHVSVVMGDDSVLVYIIDQVSDVPLEGLGMGKYLNYAGEKGGILYLMTCAGDFNSRTWSYDSRLIVKARLIE